MITPYNRVLATPDRMGGWTIETLPGLVSISRKINRRTAMIGYVNAFGRCALASATAILLVLLARRHPRQA